MYINKATRRKRKASRCSSGRNVPPPCTYDRASIVCRPRRPCELPSGATASGGCIVRSLTPTSRSNIRSTKSPRILPPRFRYIQCAAKGVAPECYRTIWSAHRRTYIQASAIERAPLAISCIIAVGWLACYTLAAVSESAQSGSAHGPPRCDKRAT